jgi:hypothetical protein
MKNNHHFEKQILPILTWQKEVRKRLGTEHPFDRRLLLDAESDQSSELG